MRCPTCDRDIGTQVEPGEFCLVDKLRKAGIAQWCAECIKNVPEVDIVNLRKKPDFFIRNAQLAKQGHKFKDAEVGPTFNDHVKVVKPSLINRIRGRF